MKKQQHFLWQYPLVLFFSFFIDSQFTVVLSDLLPFNLHPELHLFWIIVLLMSFRLEFRSHFLILIVFGLFYDLHHLQYIGVGLFFYPLLLLFLSYFKTIIRGNRLYQALSFFILIFLLEILTFTGGKVLNLTSDSYVYFITYTLAPTLVLNLIVFIISQHIIKE